MVIRRASQSSPARFGLDDIHAPIVVVDIEGFRAARDARKAAGARVDRAWCREWLQSQGAAELRLPEANEPALELWNVATLEALDDHCLARSELRLPLEDALLVFAHGGENAQLDHATTDSKGRALHLRCLCSFAREETGELLVMTLVDVTDHSALRDRLERERTRRSLANRAARLGIWEQDIGSDQAVFDEGYHSLLGLPNGALNGSIERFRDLVHPEDRQAMTEFRERVMRGETRVLERSYRLRCGDGAYRYFHCRGEVTDFDDEGTPLRAAGTILNVDAEVSSEKLLRLEGEVLGDLAADRELGSSLHRLCLGVESVWDQVRCAINLYDQDKRELTFGAAPTLPEVYRETLVAGFPIDRQPSVCGLALDREEFTYIEDFEEAPVDFEPSLPFYESIGAKSCWSMPVRVGDRFFATCCVFTLVKRAPSRVEVMQLERLARTVGLLIEAHRQRHHKAMLEAQVQTKDRLESLGKLAGGIAHDFNNLLTVIMASSELLGLEAPDDGTRESADQILRTATVAADLCKQMLTYAGESPFQLKPLRLSSVAEEIVRIVRSGTSPRVRLESSGPIEGDSILGDPAMVSQLILNLTTNAAESIQEQGTVRISTGRRDLTAEEVSSLWIAEDMEPGTYAFVRVEDDGCGIAPENARRIFDPFFSTKPEGRGLGLATVFGVLRRHHGGLDLASEPGKGTTLTVYFAVHEEGARELRPMPPPDPRGEPVIAVIDDEPAVRASLTKLLSRKGYRVSSWASGEAALEALGELEHCEAILLDQQMPGLDGVETYRRIRARAPRLPICFMSGYTTAAGLDAAVLEDPLCSSVDKPFHTNELLTTLRSLTQGRLGTRG